MPVLRQTGLTAPLSRGLSVKVCDVCEREIVGKPATSERGRWGMVMCHACWQRARKRELAKERRATFAQRVQAIQEGGPPYVWPYCELCGGDLEAHGLGYYTLKGKRRRYCCTWCRATGNSRAGALKRSKIQKARVRVGLWNNPGEHHTPETLRAAACAGGAVRAEQHRDALDAGTWANPADAPGAREKLSRPRVHGDNPALHRAIERLGVGERMAALTPGEAEAFRAHSRELQRELNQRLPNEALRQARKRAGLSLAELALRLGLARNTVWRWEAHSARPTPSNRAAAVQMLDCDPWLE